MTDEQIIEALATKVMGWTFHASPENLCGYWQTPAGNRFGAYSYWNPLTNPADSKMVREKLAERFVAWELGHYGDGKFVCEVWNRKVDGAGEFAAEADTEERAVALCVLKTVGVEV